MNALIDENYVVRTYRCPESGIVVSEQWEIQDYQRHRIGGPAVIERDRVTGSTTLTAYYENGESHRAEGQPSSLGFDENGRLMWRAFQVRGNYDRPEDLPTFEKFDPKTGHCVRAEYRADNPRFAGLGKDYILHRDNGPAVLTYDRVSGEPISVEYFSRGRRLKPPSEPHLKL